MSEEALFVSHVIAFGGQHDQLVLFDLIFLGERLLAGDALLVLHLLPEGVHYIHLSLPRNHHAAHMHVASTVIFLFLLVFHIHVMPCHNHSTAHSQVLESRLLVNYWDLIYRKTQVLLLIGRPLLYGLLLLNRRYIDLLLLRRRGNWNSLFFHLFDN
jgi:hypothetical protein